MAAIQTWTDGAAARAANEQLRTLRRQCETAEREAPGRVAAARTAVAEARKQLEEQQVLERVGAPGADVAGAQAALAAAEATMRAAEEEPAALRRAATYFENTVGPQLVQDAIRAEHDGLEDEYARLLPKLVKAAREFAALNDAVAQLDAQARNSFDYNRPEIRAAGMAFRFGPYAAPVRLEAWLRVMRERGW